MWKSSSKKPSRISLAYKNIVTDTEFLIQTVVRAASLVTDDFVIEAKDERGDLVTSFDYQIERFIIDNVKERWPDYNIISEEFNPTGKLSDNCIVIDPIDGTINFAHGLPLWGIQAALVENGLPAVSVIYLPRLNELYYANNDGAYLCTGPVEQTLLFAGQTNLLDIHTFRKISVSDTPHDRALYLVEGGNKFAALERLDKTSRHFRYFCCTALGHAWVASGRVGGFILRKDSPWDYIPGQYLVQQAGGVVINQPGRHVAANSEELAQLLFREGG